MTASKIKRRFILIFPLLIITGGAILSIYNLWLRSILQERPSTSTKQVSEKKTPAYKYRKQVNPDTEPDSSIPGWKVYTSPYLGYSIEHPGNWYIYPGEDISDSEKITTLREARTAEEAIEQLKQDRLTNQEIKVDLMWRHEENLQKGETLLNWVKRAATIEAESLPTGTKQVITEVAIGPEIRVREEFISPHDNNDKVSVYYFASNEQRIFFIAAYPSNSVLIPTFEKMLETFRFVKND